MDQHLLSVLRQRAMVENSIIAEPTLAELELHLATARMQRQRSHMLPPIRYTEALNGYPSATKPGLPLGHALSSNVNKLPCFGIKNQFRIPAAGGSSGVYFNDKEVANSMHPAGTRFPNKFCETLPVGNPLPQPPKLAASGDEHKGIIVMEPKRSRPTGDDEAEGPGPSKRARKESNDITHDPAPESHKTLSNDEKSFIEAALALSESSGRGEGESECSEGKKSPIFPRSPKSVVQGLPPPPFFLASNPLDMKDTFTVSRKRTPSPRF